MKKIRRFLGNIIPRIYNCPNVIYIRWLNSEYIIHK